ncbi:MAG: hypothetical protein ABI224_07510, partial [Acetobacteraceae bacterium]
MSKQIEPTELGIENAPPRPFEAFAREVQPQTSSRARITAAYRRPETECVPPLLAAATLASSEANAARQLARRLVETLRAKGQPRGVEGLL